MSIGVDKQALPKALVGRYSLPQASVERYMNAWPGAEPLGQGCRLSTHALTTWLYWSMPIASGAGFFRRSDVT